MIVGAVPQVLAPLLLQKVAPDDVAEILVQLALGKPRGRYADVAGPEL